MKTRKQDRESPALGSGRLVRRFGRYVYLLRKAQGYSGPELAAKAGIGKGHLSKIENRGENVSLLTILKLARALNVQAGTLVSKCEEPNGAGQPRPDERT